MSLRRGLLITLKVTLAFGFLTWLFVSGRLDFGVLANAQANWYWFVAAVLLYGLIQWMTAIRWRWLLKIVGQHCTIGRAFLIILAGLLFNQVLIGSTGGDVYRVMVFKVDDARQRVAIAVSVAMDRLVGLYALTVLIPVAALWNTNLVKGNDVLMLMVIGGTLATIALPAVSWAVFRLGSATSGIVADTGNRSGAARWLQYAKEGLHLFSGNWRIVVQALVYSLLIQMLIVGVNVFLAFALLGTGIEWRTLFLLIPVALLVMAVPINPPGAIGTGEAAYALLLELVGIAQGSIISLLQRLVNLLWALPSLLFIFQPGEIRNASLMSADEDTPVAGSTK